MKFRSSYNIPNTAIDDLIKFIKIVLKECKSIDHESFLTSLYMLRKSLGLIDQFMQFAACQKCHKLYNKESVMYYYEVQPCQISKFDYKEIKAISNSLREED